MCVLSKQICRLAMLLCGVIPFYSVHTVQAEENCQQLPSPIEAIECLSKRLDEQQKRFDAVISADKKWIGEPTGLQGAAGQKGASGQKGARGQKGDRGQKGATGSGGPRGPAGTGLKLRVFNFGTGESTKKTWFKSQNAANRRCRKEGFSTGFLIGESADGKNYHVACLK